MSAANDKEHKILKHYRYRLQNVKGGGGRNIVTNSPKMVLVVTVELLTSLKKKKKLQKNPSIPHLGD